MKFSKFLSESENQFFTTKSEIEVWIKDQLDTGTLKPNVIVNKDLSVTVIGDFTVYQGVNNKIPVRFRNVSGLFKIYWKSKIDSLKGSPDQCDQLDCSLNSSLTSLEGCPQIFKKIDADSTGIKNLKGLPPDTSGAINASDNHFLTSLEGSPKKVNGNFMITGCGGLKSLIGGPEYVKATFNASGCDLRSLVGGPTEVGSSYGIGGNLKLKSLEGVASKIGGNFVISNTPMLKSLKNIHKLVPNCKTFHFSDAVDDMLGVILITDTLIFDSFLTDANTDPIISSAVFNILKKYAGKGKHGVLNAQAELIEAGLPDVARL